MSGTNVSQVWIAANSTWYVFNFRSRLIESLIAAGYGVTVYAPPDQYVARIELLGARHQALDFDNTGTNPLYELASMLRMLRQVRNGKPDAILSYTPKVNIYLGLIARLLKLRLIPNVSGLGRSFEGGMFLKGVTKFLYRQAFRQAVVVFFQNEEDRSTFVDGQLVAPDKVRRLPGSGVDVSRFVPPISFRPRSVFTFLLAARLILEKGVGNYIEAARIIKREHASVEFHLLGFIGIKHPSSITQADIAKWESEGIVRYLGATDDVRPFYARADCVVLPSYYREGVPRVLLEAASMGIPIITTDMPGCRDAVDDGVTGFLCSARDTGDLADQMRKMLQLSPEARKRMGQAGREKMESSFDERVVIATYMELLADLLPPNLRLDQQTNADPAVAPRHSVIK